MQAVAQPRSYAPVTNTKDNPPCNTLFIGNLSEHTSEDELRGIFQGQPGALLYKCLARAGCVVYGVGLTSGRGQV